MCLIDLLEKFYFYLDTLPNAEKLKIIKRFVKLYKQGLPWWKIKAELTRMQSRAGDD